MTEQRISYAGERVYVGVDVHKETYTVTCVCHTQRVKTATVPAEPASLAASLLRWFPGATRASAYEAGFSAFVWHRALTQAGITNIVVNPASIAVAANDKVKTDRRDSKRLAIDLADGRLRGISIPTEAEELARLLPRVVFQKWRWPCLHCPSKGIAVDKQAEDDVMHLGRFRKADGLAGQAFNPRP